MPYALSVSSHRSSCLQTLTRPDSGTKLPSNEPPVRSSFTPVNSAPSRPLARRRRSPSSCSDTPRTTDAKQSLPSKHLRKHLGLGTKTVKGVLNELSPAVSNVTRQRSTKRVHADTRNRHVPVPFGSHSSSKCTKAKLWRSVSQKVSATSSGGNRFTDRKVPCWLQLETSKRSSDTKNIAEGIRAEADADSGVRVSDEVMPAGKDVEEREEAPPPAAGVSQSLSDKPFVADFDGSNFDDVVLDEDLLSTWPGSEPLSSSPPEADRVLEERTTMFGCGTQAVEELRPVSRRGSEFDGLDDEDLLASMPDCGLGGDGAARSMPEESDAGECKSCGGVDDDLSDFDETEMVQALERIEQATPSLLTPLGTPSYDGHAIFRDASSRS